jgi:hypothetical protein
VQELALDELVTVPAKQPLGCVAQLPDLVGERVGQLAQIRVRAGEAAGAYPAGDAAAD